jgi:hypothetical protein
MNLNLDPAQRELAATVQKAASLADVSPHGTFEWCLAYEELGTHLVAPGPEQPDLLMRAAYAVGVGRRCLETAQARACDRVIAGRPLIEFQGPAHRLANAAFDLACARVGVWRTAWEADQGSIPNVFAPAAACVSAAVACAHELVQTFGAAGTSVSEVVRLYQAAYALPTLCGSPGELWRRAGEVA